MRRPVVGGNWKMNTDRASAVALANAVRSGAETHNARCEIVVYPPFPYLEAVGAVLSGGEVRLGAQDLWSRPYGAFTGEVSAAMLLDLGVTDVLVGHSERRHVIGEDDRLVREKLDAALAAGLAPTLCVGETLAQREAGQTQAVNRAQLEEALAGVAGDDLARLTVAYEPVWAIGTGRTATPGDAEAVHRTLRRVLAERYDESASESVRIVYGGSVKPQNAADLFAPPDVDGGLIGGASLDGGAFLEIVGAAAATVPAARS